MPPLTYSSFEEIEAREWAFNTIETILTDVTPVTFEMKNDMKLLHNQQVVKGNTSNISYLKRSLSFLEGKTFGSQDITRNSRRSQSTIIPNTQHQSYLQDNLTLQPHLSFKSRIRHAWHIESPSFIHHHKKTSKEQKGISIWKNKFKEYLITPPKEVKVKSHSKNSIQLSKFIMNELLSTEETYLNHLMTIKHFYMDPLIKATNAKSALVNTKNIEVIFAYIPELIALSNSLIKRLQNTISTYLEDETKRNDVSIGRTFCDFEPYFEIYIAYAVNYSKSRKLLTSSSSNIAYRELIQDTMRKKDANRLTLSDYMIAPIQRITRYCLLLTDLLKHMNNTHHDYVYLSRALKSLSALAYAMNAVQ